MTDHAGPPPSLNLNVRGMQPSATVAINEHSNALIAAGRTVYKLGLGQSPFPVPPSVVDSLRQHAHHKEYMPVRGLPELRTAVAEFHRRRAWLRHGYQAEDVLVAPGSKELMFIVQLAFYGDLLLPSPSWVSYSPQARIIGRQVNFLPTCGPEIDEYLVHARGILRALGTWSSEKLAAACARCHRPEGGFYLFPDFSGHAQRLRARGIADGDALCARLLAETGVAILPGSDFGRPPGDWTARLAYVDFDGEQALAEHTRDAIVDEAWLRRMTPRVTTALDRMCDWLVRG